MPARHYPNRESKTSEEEQLSKGVTHMVRICTIALAMILLSASWVSAGSFEVLAEAGVVRAPTPLHIKPGALVKADFKSNLRTTSDAEIDSDNLLPEKVSAQGDPKVAPKPAVAFRERSTGQMAPPPGQKKDVRGGPVAESMERAVDMEEELEKDLVLSPPAPRNEDEEETRVVPPRVESKPAVEKKPVVEPVVKERKEAVAPAKPKKAPSDQGRLSITLKPVQKVRPLSTTNAWNHPAGSYQDRRAQAPRPPRVSNPCAMDDQQFRPMNPPYMCSAPRQAIAPPPTADRFVRDGVTIRLAPAAAPPVPPQYQEEPSQNDDLFSAIGEVLGLPLAFISSFF